MLLKIREKSQGVFSWVILILICVPFALWGIQNYVGGGSELTVASVGEKEFFQQDLNKAYAQYSQSLAGTNFDENEVKKQALDKLIRDEVLLQYVQEEGLVVADRTAKEFIKTLDYFQTDGKFNQKQYKSLLAAQRMSTGEFVARIKKALVMEQFQRTVVASGFATEKDIENFFRIQNQQRDVEMMSIALEKVETEPADSEIESYYKQNQKLFLTEELVSIEYVELTLDELAKQVTASEEDLKAYYEEQKDLYTTKERRKISHILFAFTKDSDDDALQLEKALKAVVSLKDKSFSVLAAELSDDKLTASKGGDLGLFNIGVMEQAFEDAASSLKLGEVSAPVKSAFGYHLIKVTELIVGDIKPYEGVKVELTAAFQRAQAENTFYELGETLTDVSFENPDNLQAVADALGVDVKQTQLFSRKGITELESKDNSILQASVVNVAFSEDVLKGNNSEPVELGTDRLVVLRLLEHKTADVKALGEVKALIMATLLNNKARALTLEKANKIKNAVVAGKAMTVVAEENALKVEQFSELSRSNGDLPWQINQAIFKIAKPVDGKPMVTMIAAPSGAQTIINLLSVKEGKMTASDKAKAKLAERNMAQAFGQADFNASLNSLQKSADISINMTE